MATPGTSVVRDSGKLGVLPDGRIAVFAGGPCGCCGATCDGAAVRWERWLISQGTHFVTATAPGSPENRIPFDTTRTGDSVYSNGSPYVTSYPDRVDFSLVHEWATTHLRYPKCSGASDDATELVTHTMSLSGTFVRATGRWSGGGTFRSIVTRPIGFPGPEDDVQSLAQVSFSWFYDEIAGEYVTSASGFMHVDQGEGTGGEVEPDDIYVVADAAFGVVEGTCSLQVVVSGNILHFFDDCPSYGCGWGPYADMTVTIVEDPIPECDQYGDRVRVLGTHTPQGSIDIPGGSVGAIEYWHFSGHEISHDGRCPDDGSPLCDHSLIFPDPPNPTSGFVDVTLPFTAPAEGLYLCNPAGLTLPSREVVGEVKIQAFLDVDGRWYNGFFEVEGVVGSYSYIARFRFSWNGSAYDVYDELVGQGSAINPDEVIVQNLVGYAAQETGSCTLRLVLSGNYAAWGDYNCGTANPTATWGCAPYAEYFLTIESSAGGGGGGGFTI